MARIFAEDELVIATHNAGKAREISELLEGFVPKFYTAADLGLPEPDETETTFTGNAELKALAAAQASGKVALADDSGLAVAALAGDPGIYSARWAVQEDGSRDFNAAMRLVEEKLVEHADKSAAFICALSLAWPDGHIETVEGKVEGMLEFPPRGDKGFGYDPIFVPNGYSKTFAEIDPAEKHSISHRADAFERLLKLCFKAEAA